jgi:hypothetical protein
MICNLEHRNASWEDPSTFQLSHLLPTFTNIAGELWVSLLSRPVPNALTNTG